MLFPIRFTVKVIVGLTQFFLGFQFLLRLFGANVQAPFVRWIYETAAPLLHPFEGMFPPTRIDGYIFDFTTLFALFVYMFFGYLVMELIDYVEHRSLLWRKERP